MNELPEGSALPILPSFTAKNATADQTPERIALSLNEILTANRLMSIATVRGKLPYVCALIFAYAPDLTLYFVSQPTTEHVKNLEAQDDIACAIAHSEQSWDRPRRGLQIYGHAFRPTGADLKKATDAYFARWPGMRRAKFDPETGKDKDLHTHLFAIKPSFCKIFDEKIFGHETFVELNLS